MRLTWLAPLMALTVAACSGGKDSGREKARRFEPTTIEGLGEIYTRHLYVVHRNSVE